MRKLMQQGCLAFNSLESQLKNGICKKSTSLRNDAMWNSPLLSKSTAKC